MKPACATRQRLLETAAELIWGNSYGAVSVDDICARAGARKGSFYHFFPSKSDLAVAAFEEHWQRSQAALDRAFSPQVPPLERFDRYLDVLISSQRDQFTRAGRVCGCPYGSLGCEVSTLDENIRRKAEEMAARSCRYLESALRDLAREGRACPDACPALKARELYAYVTGMMLQAKIQNSLALLERMRPGFYRLLGLRPCPEAEFATFSI